MKLINKKILFVILTFILILPLTSTANENPKEKGNKPLTTQYKIVLFNDLDDYNPTVKFPYGTFPATEALYYYILKNSIDMGPYTMESSYAAFFQNYNINDFDIAIFPVGDKALTYSAAGHRIIDIIETMLTNRKRVLIIGRSVMTNQFGGGDSDLTVGELFSRDLGLEFTGRPKMLNSNGTYKNFVVYGTPYDSISYNQVKFFNASFIYQGQQYSPIRYNSDVEVFKIKNGSRSVPVNSFTRDSRIDDGIMDGDSDLTYYYNRPPNTDSLVTIRCEPSIGGKVVFWSLGWDNACDWFAIQYMQFEILRAVQWCSWEHGGLIYPEKYILFDKNEMDFGNVPVGQSDTLPLKITNFGRTDLTITDTLIEGDPNSVFKLLPMGQPLPIKLAPNQSISLHIVFRPDTTIPYIDYLDITSDAKNTESGKGISSIILKGNGGSQPQVCVPVYNNGNGDTIYFGQVKLGPPKVLPITIKNIGSIACNFSKIQMIDNDNNSFSFDTKDDGKYPITVEPDSTYLIHIRFTPLQAGQPYIGHIQIDGKNLYFTGQGAPNAPQIFSRDTVLDFGYVQKGDTLLKSFGLTNAGNQNLSVDSMYIVQDTNNAYSLVNPPSLPAQITFNSGDQIKTNVRFVPMRDDSVIILGAVKIHSNDPNTPYYYINLLGRGAKKLGINENPVSDANGILSIKACPNPFGESTIIQYTLYGNVSRNIEIYAVDIIGNKVAELINNFHSPGEYRFNFKTDKLISGTYFIVAKANDAIIRLPVVIVK
ncbi:MAG: choice-of-anchor D domain-containing protein [FCB group bacterium]|jgi:hypothetical protein